MSDLSGRHSDAHIRTVGRPVRDVVGSESYARYALKIDASGANSSSSSTKSSVRSGSPAGTDDSVRIIGSQQTAVRRLLHFGFCGLIVFLLLGVFTPVHADSVYRILDFRDRPAPEEYGELRGSLIYSSDNRLYRVATPGGQAVEIPFASFNRNGQNEAVRFSNLGNALYFVANVKDGANVTRSIYRMDDPRQTPVRIRTPSPPATALIEYGGALYFFATRLGPNPRVCGGRGWFYSLYRLGENNRAPVEMAWNNDGRICDSYIADLSASEYGLLFRGRLEPNGQALGSSTIYLIQRPQPVARLQGAVPDYSIAVSKVSVSADRQQEVLAYDGNIFYAGEHDARVRHPLYPGYGPYEDPGRLRTLFDPFEVELYRLDGDGSMFFDLRRQRAGQIDAQIQTGLRDVGSSYPRRMVIADGVLYFQALDTREGSELFRLTSAGGVPQRMKLNPDAPSRAIPVGEFDGRLFLVADIGEGYDIHYLADDGRTPVPLGVGAAVATSSQGFIEFDGGVAFSARDGGGRSATWYFRAGVVAPITNPTYPISLTIDDMNDRSKPGIEVDAGEAVVVNCLFRNDGSAAIRNPKLALRWFSADDAPQAIRDPIAACRREALDPGRAMACKRSVRARPGASRVACIATARDETSTRVRVRDVSVLTGTTP